MPKKKKPITLTRKGRLTRCPCGLIYLPGAWRTLRLARRSFGQNIEEERICTCGRALRIILDGDKRS